MQGDMGKGFQAVIGGINSLGASINSIALGVQSMTSSLKTSIGKQVKAANTIEKVQKEAIKADDDREREKIKNEQRQKKLEQRNQLAFIGFKRFQQNYLVRKILVRIEYHLY